MWWCGGGGGVHNNTTACHLVMDSFYYQLMDVFQKKRKSTRGVVELKGDEMAVNVCKELAKHPHLYGLTAEKMCNDFLNEYKTEIVALFSRNFEINDNVDNFYHLKHGLCEKVHTGCMRPQDKPRIDDCDACKLLMEDTERVFSWGLGRKNFATSQHIYRVLDDMCLNLLVRHPVRYHHKLLEICGDLTDDYSAQIVKVISESLKTKGPSPARKICIDVTKLCPKEKQPAVEKTEL